jgi:thiol-disulfide isomerase/thioredoxin
MGAVVREALGKVMGRRAAALARAVGAVLALVAVIALAIGPAPLADAATEMALCPVCRVKEGTHEEEAVEAVRTHEGVRYGFCSEQCAKEFDLDPAAYAPPAFPRPAPELGLTDLTGKLLTWDSLEGQVVLVDFWATWCAPCRKSMPELQALHQRYAERGFTVIGISIDEGKARGKVKKFVSARKVGYPIALDSEKSPAWERFRVKAIPAAFLVDPEGRIVAQWTGTTAGADELAGRIEALLPQAMGGGSR